MNIQVGKTYEISRKAVPVTATGLNRTAIPARIQRIHIFAIKAIEGGKTIHYGDRLDGNDRMTAFVLPDSNIASIKDLTA